MQITPELIDHLATLSKLNPTPEQKITLTADLEKMIAMVDKLQEVEVGDTPPLMHMHNLATTYRQDEIKPHMTNEDAMKLAANANAPYFAVPKVIDQP
jgi:aspartyl-tRNA(Asn)/glutamyl-tRNA(Gln) amidotransferase subunit C